MLIEWEVYGPDGVTPVGVVDGIRSASCVARIGGIGTVQVVWDRDLCPPEVTAAVEDGRAHLRCRIVDLPAGPLLLHSGPAWGTKTSRGDSSSDRLVTVTGQSDEWFLSKRKVYTSPGAAWGSQTAATRRWPASGTTAAETIIRAIVNEQGGPGALTARRIPRLVLEPAHTTPAGASTSRQANLGDSVLDIVSELADAAGVVWRVEPGEDGSRTLRVWAPELRGDVLLSVEADTLRAAAFEQAGPTCSVALASASDTVHVEQSDPAVVSGYGRLEEFVSAGGTDTETIVNACDVALTEGAPSASLTVTAVETDDVRIGRDVWLGDRVPYLAPVGAGVVEMVDVVREISVDQGTDGTRASLTVGTPGAGTTPAMWARLRKVEKRVRVQAPRR